MILTYNPYTIHASVPALRERGLINPVFSDEDIAFYRTPFGNTSHAFIDRSGNLPHFLPITHHSPHPTPIAEFAKTFRQIALERATELLATGKRINIMWSGGIDSTTVLFALLSQCSDASQLRVILTYDSVVESAGIFDRHIHNKLDYVLTTRLPKAVAFERCEYDLEHDLIVSGTCADQILDGMHLPAPLSTKMLDLIKPATDKSPRPLVTDEDYAWFVKFNFCWDAVKYNQQFGADKRYHGLIQPFYDYDDFQRWSILGRSQPDYEEGNKQVARHLIAEISNEKDYAYRKPKTYSSQTTSALNKLGFLTVSGDTVYIE